GALRIQAIVAIEINILRDADAADDKWPGERQRIALERVHVRAKPEYGGILLLTSIAANWTAALHIAAGLPVQPVVAGPSLELQFLSERPLITLTVIRAGIGGNEGEGDIVAVQAE